MTRLQLNDSVFCAETNSIERLGKTIRIERRASDLLYVLAMRQGEIVSKKELIDIVWNGAFVSKHSIAVAISDIRKALGDDWRNPEYIETVPKRGYRLIASTRSVETGQGSTSRLTLVSDSGIVKVSRLFPHPGRSVLAGFAALFCMVLAIVFSGSNGSTATVTPILVSDFCTGEVPVHVTDRAYGLNRIISNALQEDKTNRIIRAPSGQIPMHQSEAGSESIILDGALVQTETGLMLVIEFINAKTRVILWSGSYDLSETSPERIAVLVSRQLSTAKKAS